MDNSGGVEHAPRVLIVDDDELIAGSLRGFLATNGCACDVATDAAEAHRLMALRQYAVVLIDPYLTGGISDSLEQIRALQMRAHLIVATAYASPRLHIANRNQEIQLVEKPQPIATLSNLVIGALDLSNLEEKTF